MNELTNTKVQSPDWGTVVATHGALDLLDRHGLNPAILLHRHMNGDFGDLDPADIGANFDATVLGLRIW